MPKAAKNPRAKLHSKAAALAKAEKAQQSQQTQADPVAAVEVDTVAGPERARLEKRRKGAMLAVQAASVLATPSTHPYSRSHLKRLKKRARENLVGGSLTSINAALDGMLPDADAGDVAASGSSAAKAGMDVDGDVGEKSRARTKTAVSQDVKKIGEGRGKPLKESAKRKEMIENQARMQAVMKNPAFKKNPFEAIRIHASNSMLMQEKA